MGKTSPVTVIERIQESCRLLKAVHATIAYPLLPIITPWWRIKRERDTFSNKPAEIEGMIFSGFWRCFIEGGMVSYINVPLGHSQRTFGGVFLGDL